MIASLAGFLMGFIGSMPVAGPTSLLVFHRGMLARYRDGWAIGLGGGLAEGTYCAIAVHGFSTLHDSVTFFEPLARGVGFLLLLTVGLYFIFARHEHPKEAPTAKPPHASWGGQFCAGLSLAMLNPTLLLTWSGSVALLHSITNISLHGYNTIAFAASVVLGIVAWFSILLTLQRRFRRHFPFSLLSKAIRTIGVLLVFMSITLAGSTVYASIHFS